MTFDIIATILLLGLIVLIVAYIIHKHKYNQAKYDIFKYFTQEDMQLSESIILPLLNKETLNGEYNSSAGNFNMFKELVSETCANNLMGYVTSNRDRFDFDYKVLEFSVMKDVSDKLFDEDKYNNILKDVFYGNIKDTIDATVQDVQEYDDYFDQFIDEENNREEPSDENDDDEGVEGCHPEEINKEDYKEEIDKPTTVEELYAKFADIVEDIDEDN